MNSVYMVLGYNHYWFPQICVSPEVTATGDPFSMAEGTSAGPAEEEWDLPLVTSLKVGGGGFFSGKKEGYSMTLHAKNGKPGCISF